MFNQKELGMIVAFEQIDDESDMIYWTKEVEELPAVRAALIFREVLMNKIKTPLIQRQQMEELESQFWGRIQDTEDYIAQLEGKLEEERERWA